MDLSLGSAGLKEELIHQILLLKDPRLQDERRSLYTNYLKLTGSMKQAKVKYDAHLKYHMTRWRMDSSVRVEGHKGLNLW